MKDPGTLRPCGFLCGIIALLLQMGPAWARELWVVDPQGLKGPENALLASIQGVLNRTGAVVWVKGPGMSARILDELRSEGWVLRVVLP